MEINTDLAFSNKQHNRYTDPYGLPYKLFDDWLQNPTGKYFFIKYFRNRDDEQIIKHVRENKNVYYILHDNLEGYAKRRFNKIHNFVSEHNLQNKVFFNTSLKSTAEEYQHWLQQTNNKKIFTAFYYPEWYHRVYDNLIDYRLKKLSYQKDTYFCCLNNRHHEHRVLLVQDFQNNNVIDKGIVSSDFHKISIDGVGSRPNDYNPLIYNKSLINVVTETFYRQEWNETGNIFFSEKIWKPIVCKQAFIVVGPKHTLKYLKDLGFKTFEDIWDESYDSVDYKKRLYMAANSLYNTIDNYSVDQLNVLTKEIREHNFKHFKKIRKEMIKTCW